VGVSLACHAALITRYRVTVTIMCQHRAVSDIILIYLSSAVSYSSYYTFSSSDDVYFMRMNISE